MLEYAQISYLLLVAKMNSDSAPSSLSLLPILPNGRDTQCVYSLCEPSVGFKTYKQVLLEIVLAVWTLLFSLLWPRGYTQQILANKCPNVIQFVRDHPLLQWSLVSFISNTSPILHPDCVRFHIPPPLYII